MKEPVILLFIGDKIPVYRQVCYKKNKEQDYYEF
jgi:hypothetical protein